MNATTKALSCDPYAGRASFDLSSDVGPLTPLSEETVRLARLEVCARAVDADEAGELLAMLGLGEDA